MASQVYDGSTDAAMVPGEEKQSSPVVKDVASADDPNAPSTTVSSKKQSLSDIFTIFCAGFALISDGYQNSLM